MRFCLALLPQTVKTMAEAAVSIKRLKVKVHSASAAALLALVCDVPAAVSENTADPEPRAVPAAQEGQGLRHRGGKRNTFLDKTRLPPRLSPRGRVGRHVADAEEHLF